MRDEWTNNQIERIKKSMEFLIPPKEQDDFYICQQKSIDSGYELIENNFSDEFDYKIKSVFDGENFITAFSGSDASVGLVIGGFIALLFTFVVNNNVLFLFKYARKVACGRSFQYKKR